MDAACTIVHGVIACLAQGENAEEVWSQLVSGSFEGQRGTVVASATLQGALAR